MKAKLGSLTVLVRTRNGMRLCSSLARVLGLTVLLGCGAAAQTQTIRIWPGVAPGSEQWTQTESILKGKDSDRIVNVVTPTLTVYLPEKNRSTGTGVIIAPGGGFTHLTIDKEGYRVASWLQERGIAAFVLKYRVKQLTPQEVEAASARTAGTGTAAGAAASQSSAKTEGAKRGPAAPEAKSMDSVREYGIADGIQALKVLRQRAQEFGLRPERIGIAGFSAGGIVTAGVLLQADPAARPAFAAPIYGAPSGVLPTLPRQLPPVFMAWSQDDRTAGSACGRFCEALKAAGAVPEVHLFSSGGHGFGMSQQGTSSDHWIEEFYFWLQAQGFAQPAS